ERVVCRSGARCPGGGGARRGEAGRALGGPRGFAGGGFCRARHDPMRAKRASQLQGEPRGPRAATGVRGASEARSAAKPREHWTGPPEVMEGPGADGPFRAGAGSAVVVRMLGGDRAGVVPYTHVVHAVKTERKLWSSAWQLPLCVARSHTTGLCAPPMGRVGRTFGWGAAVGPGSWCSTHAPR